MDRGENSAINLLRRFLARPGPHTGDLVRYADVFTAIDDVLHIGEHREKSRYRYRMRVVKFLFSCHLLALAFALCGLLLISPHPELWNSDPARGAAFQFLLRSASSLQIIFGAVTLLFFGFLCVGPRNTLIFFTASMILSLFLGVLITSKTVLLGVFSPAVSPSFSQGGLEISIILLSWFYMGFTSYLLACRLVVRLGLRRQTFWSLALGTYFLIAWDVALNAALAGIHVPTQLSMVHTYGSSFGLPVSNLLNWSISGLIFLGVSRLLWRGDLNTQDLAIWLPFGIYTANIGFVMILSFGVGLWFPLLLSAVFVLAPEALAFYPREDAPSVRKGRVRASLNQVTWLMMRAICLVFARRRIMLKVEGQEHIPSSGPVLIAARHFHYLFDGYILVRTVPRRLHVIVSLDWLQIQSLRLLIELACSLVDWPVVLRDTEMRRHTEEKRWAYQPVEGRRYLRQLMQSAARLLRSGEVLVIFPEGHPNIDPHPTPKQDLEAFLPFQPGFVRMTELAERDRQTHVAIVPVGLAYHRVDKARWQATVRFGPPLFLRNFASPEEACRAAEERVRALSHLAPASTASASATVEPPGETLLP